MGEKVIRRTELIGNQTLILADCSYAIPILAEDNAFDAIVTDPPYGIGYKYNSYKDKGGEDYVRLMKQLTPYSKCILQYPEETMKYLVPLFGAPDQVFTWCYNSNTARQSRIFSFWGLDVDFKRHKIPAKNPKDKRVSSMVSSYDWTSDYQQVKNVSKEKTDHPCQVPIGLMEVVVKIINAKTILDPFMGSGTTLIACEKNGRQGIGIEIDEKYFEIACQRVSDAASQMTLTLETADEIL